MKIEDAAQWLTEDIKECESDRGKYKGSPFKDGIERRKELYVIALSAVEKQIPKEPIKEPAVWPDGRERIKILCPVCHEDVSSDYTYCDECGQRLK